MHERNTKEYLSQVRCFRRGRKKKEEHLCSHLQPSQGGTSRENSTCANMASSVFQTGPDVLLPRFLHTSKSRFFEVQLPAGARLVLPLSSEGRRGRKMQLLLGRTTSPRGPSRRREWEGKGRWTERSEERSRRKERRRQSGILGNMSWAEWSLTSSLSIVNEHKSPAGWRPPKG